MALTRAQARSLIRELIDDTAAKLWSDANLDILTEGGIDILWGELLDHKPWLRSIESAALTPAAPGTVDTATQLTRFYRVQQVARDGMAYTEADPKDVLVVAGQQITAPSRTWVMLDSSLHLFPYDTAANIYVRYSSRPTAYTGLANDNTVVSWPDGYHMAYVYDAASRALEKGDREKSDTFRARAADEMARLRAYLRTVSVGPRLPWTPDGAEAWGSV